MGNVWEGPIGRARPLSTDPDFDLNDRVAWLLERQKRIGSSDVGKLFGYRGTALEIYISKVEAIDPTPRRKLSNVLAAFGRYSEAFLADLYTELTGLRTIRPPSCADPDNDLLGASPDRLVLDERGEVIGGLELKRPSAFSDAYRDGRYPPGVHLQCVWQQRVTSIKRWELFALVGDSRPALWRIPWSAELAEDLVEGGLEFWSAHVEPRNPPDPMTSAELRAAIDHRFPEAATLIEADDTAQGIAERLAVLRDRKKTIKGEIKAIEDLLLCVLGDAGADKVKGPSWSASYRPRTGRVGWRAVALELAELIAIRAGFEGDRVGLAANKLLETFGERHRAPAKRSFRFNWRGDLPTIAAPPAPKELPHNDDSD